MSTIAMLCSWQITNIYHHSTINEVWECLRKNLYITFLPKINRTNAVRKFNTTNVNEDLNSRTYDYMSVIAELMNLNNKLAKKINYGLCPLFQEYPYSIKSYTPCNKCDNITFGNTFRNI